MGFWIFMMVMNGLIPITMIVFGRYFMKTPPKNVNHFFGYRTRRSMKNTETWDFAHRYFGKIWMIHGIILLVVSLVAMFFVMGEASQTIGIFGGVLSGIQCLMLFVAIIPTERALKNKFSPNSKNLKKEKKITTATLFMMAVGGVLGFFGGNRVAEVLALESSLSQKALQMSLVLAGLIIAVLLQLVVHEMGHLVFGLISGYQFVSIRFGSLMLIKKSDQYQLKRFSLTGTGGQCLMGPPKHMNGRMPYRLYLMGGTLFNLIFSGLILCIYYWVGQGSVFETFLFFCAAMGFAFALLNGIPMRLGAVDNDGYHALHMKDSEVLRCFHDQLKINQLLTDGYRLNAMPEALFNLPSKDQIDNPLCAAIWVFACNRAVDQMDFNKAITLADELLQTHHRLIGIHNAIVTAERICCELVTDNRKAITECLQTKTFTKYKKAMASQLSMIRLRFAEALLLDHNEKVAKDIQKRFDRVARSYPHMAEVESERELMAHIYTIWQQQALGRC